MENKNLTRAELECLEADHPYSRWATIPGVIKTTSEPTPEQRALAEEINAQRVAVQGDLENRKQR